MRVLEQSAANRRNRIPRGGHLGTTCIYGLETARGESESRFSAVTEKRRRPDDGYSVPLCCTLIVMLVLVLSACVKPALTAKEQTLTPFDRVFEADANQTYYAIRWALAAVGYPVGSEDLQNGLIGTTWIPTRAGAQFLDPFDRHEQTSRDWGNNSGYFKLAFHVQPESGKTRVTVTAYVRSIVANLKSSGEQEQLVLNKVGDYLRGADPEVTNIGIAQPK